MTNYEKEVIWERERRNQEAKNSDIAEAGTGIGRVVLARTTSGDVVAHTE